MVSGWRLCWIHCRGLIMSEDKKHRLSKAQKEMLVALEACANNVALACEQVSTGRTVHYKWLKNNPKYKEGVQEIRNALVDLAESKLYINVKKGNQKAIEYLLDSQGKERGYGKTLQVTGKDGNAIEHSHTATPELIAAARKTVREHFK